MRLLATSLAIASLLVVGEAASISESSSVLETARPLAWLPRGPTRVPSFARFHFANTSSDACATVSTIVTQNPGSFIPALTALDCLKSVPVNVNRSVAFIDFIKPYLEFQSTLAYLKNPPTGWLFPGVDIFGGLTQMKDLLTSGQYANQWDFEKDLYSMINILPHDFHVNLPMPLVSSVFIFTPLTGPLVSISSDGLSLPKVFFKRDLDRSLLNAAFIPSAVTTVNGQDINTYLQRTAQTLSSYGDPDSTYNTLFFSLPFTVAGIYSTFEFGQIFGFDSDSNNYTFENGTTSSFDNVAIANIPFDGITSGAALFDVLNPTPPPDTPTSNTTTPFPSTTTSAQIIPTTSLLGYPTPIVIHRSGYTSGYFLSDSNSDTAVLALQSFIDANETDPLAFPLQSQAVADFLAACRAANKTKLIVDLQGNGGGIVAAGYDVFYRLFPTIMPFGATRMRDTPAARYLGEVFTRSAREGETDESLNGDFEAQSYVDLKNNTFADWNTVDPPETIYGDNFTAQVRYKPALAVNTSIALTPQVFESRNIVLLYDGTCGSTCAVFSEFMKSQGGVRSVVMGGRSQFGPMQGVAGSKGAEVLRYLDIDTFYGQIPTLLPLLANQSAPLPSPPAASFLPPGVSLSWPLGSSTTQSSRARFNLRNNIRRNDTPTADPPLQFVYEASNCRLFYKKEDLYRIDRLWDRVREVVWGGGRCVNGSSVGEAGGFPGGVEEVRGYTGEADSKVRLAKQPGLVGVGGGGKADGEGDGSGTESFRAVRTAVAVNGTVYTDGFVMATSTGTGVGATRTSASASATVQSLQMQASASGTAFAAQFTGGAAGVAREERGKLMGLVGVVVLRMMI
ncbi:hypothetical protein ACMFMG_006088 [Clarireedia jacksonii]